MKGAQFWEGLIQHDGNEMGVKAVILPFRHAPHVSADSPRHMEPGRPAKVVYYELFNDMGDDITTKYFLEADRKAIHKLILDEYVIDRTAEIIMERSVV